MSSNLVIPSLKRRVKCCQSCAAEILQQHRGRNTKILLFLPERGPYQQKEAPEFVSALYKYSLQQQWCYQSYCKASPRCVMRCRQTGKQDTGNEMAIPPTQHRRLADGARELILLTTTELLVLWILLEGTRHPREL